MVFVVIRVVVEEDAVVLAGGVAVVVAHGQVASPSLKVKRSHSPASDRYVLSVLHLQVPYMLSPWMCIYGLLYMLSSLST